VELEFSPITSDPARFSCYSRDLLLRPSELGAAFGLVATIAAALPGGDTVGLLAALAALGSND